MPRIIISERAFNLIRANAVYEFRTNGHKLPDGRWEIPLEDETILRIKVHALAGETLSDTIERVLSTTKGAN